MLLYTHTLEVHSESATLYLHGALGGVAVAVARATCARLPSSVRLLRVDARGINDMDAAAGKEIVTLVRYWRRERLGHAIVVGLDDDCDNAALNPRIAWMTGVQAYTRPAAIVYTETRAEEQALMGMYL